MMNNFDNGTQVENIYLGSEIKTRFIFNNTYYMIKIPDPIREKRNTLSYMNNQFSEYIGSHIYDLIGIPVQETILGTVSVGGKTKISVGCKDFNYDGLNKIHELLEMDTIANWLNPEERIKETIEYAYLFFDTKPNLNRELAVKRFWDMFVVDGLIMNGDRHFHNIGFWVENDSIIPAPVYDCGSSLGALYSDDDLLSIMSDKTYFKSVVFNTPSCYKKENKRVFFHEELLNPNDDLTNSILDIVPRINLNSINEMIDDTPYLSDVRKEFYKEVIKFNKSNMLDLAYKKCVNKNISNDIDSMIKGTYNPNKSNNDEGYTK